jgi:hypothetical protein
MATCKNCGHMGNERFCPECGEQLVLERPSVRGLLGEAVHTFTHFDEGFLYTLKQLAIRPGSMQRQYLTGPRRHFHKPFSMFAICASFCALSLYFIYKPSHDDVQQVFYKSYYTFAQTAMIPVYAFTTWILFRPGKWYYGESLILIIYMLAFITLLVIPINLLQFVLPNGPVTLIELSVFTIYTVRTYLNFFRGRKTWVMLKSIFGIALNFLLFQLLSNQIIKWFMH